MNKYQHYTDFLIKELIVKQLTEDKDFNFIVKQTPELIEVAVNEGSFDITTLEKFGLLLYNNDIPYIIKKELDQYICQFKKAIFERAFENELFTGIRNLPDHLVVDVYSALKIDSPLKLKISNASIPTKDLNIFNHVDGKILFLYEVGNVEVLVSLVFDNAGTITNISATSFDDRKVLHEHFKGSILNLSQGK